MRKNPGGKSKKLLQRTRPSQNTRGHYQALHPLWLLAKGLAKSQRKIVDRTAGSKAMTDSFRLIFDVGPPEDLTLWSPTLACQPKL